MKIILINGQSGTGKSSVAKALMSGLKDSAHIEVDSLVATNPWEFGGKTDDLAIKNAVSLIHNFSKSGFDNIVVSGLTRNQILLDQFLEQLKHDAEIIFIWLRADKEIRKSRKLGRDRDDADKQESFDVVDRVYPDIQSIELKNGKSLFIDTSSKSIPEVVEDIQTFLK